MGRRRSGVTRLRAAATAVALALLGSVLPASPAEADVLVDWEFATRASGMPATDTPARTLASVDLGYVADDRPGRLAGSVVLGAAPVEESAADLHLALGEAGEDGSCVIRWEMSVPTLVDTQAARREGATLRLEMPVGADVLRWSCGHVSLTAPGDAGTIYDRLDGRAGFPVVADPYGSARILHISGTHVPADRWAPLRVTVRLGGRATGVRVIGRGERVRVQPGVAHPRGSRRTVTVVVFVRVHSARPTRLRLLSQPLGSFAFADSELETVRLHPR